MRTPRLVRCRAALVAGVVALSLSPAAPSVGAAVAQAAHERRAGESTTGSSQAPYAVRAERQLRSLQCAPGRADGTVDERTRAAVTRFQSASGLKQSGRLNPATRQALRAPGAADCLDRPVPARSGQGRRIVVSQTQNFLWMVGRDGNAFHRAPVVDNPDVLSPGTWRTGSYCGRAARIWRNQDLTYREWLYGFVRFAPCGIGFHRIPIWQSTGKQIHPDWWLGTDMDASEGCIRLDRRTMQRVWDFTARATTTVVVLP
ncbi:L,D-transpeptidase family protein [Nocardioidaceae bacterium]|nr:L,D-transpeptidase family protein [Nocardioidaceae bacterium]